MADQIASLWWLPLLRGILLLFLGVYALINPGMTLAVFAQVIGFFLVLDGVLSIVAGVIGQTPTRTWSIVRGILVGLVGIFVFANPVLVAGITATAIVYLIAFTTILAGVFEIVAAIQHRAEMEGEGWLIAEGALLVLFGIILVLAPMLFGLTMIRILGVFAILAGIGLIVFAFRIKKLPEKVAEIRQQRGGEDASPTV
ncbi:hypothetical protein FYK55_24850 [Roseiconus nitratireducens]|uniref:Acid-resistance membrane protein n=2 Tax=Roseiconus nitratireducens TaxID=2605748 RepID=A0A5M6D2I5_9BACT|nr:hypothetical protein FYK55_24850 [Roseiconus nitratireducens]